MRQLIDKLTLLESSGVTDLPKIGQKFKRIGEFIIINFDERLNPETLNVDKKLIIKKKSGEKIVNIKFIIVKFTLFTSTNLSGDLDVTVSPSYIDIETQPKLRDSDLDDDSDYNFIIDIADKISQFIGFKKNIFKIHTDFVFVDSGAIMTPINGVTKDGLKMLNAAYKWRQDTVGDL